MIETTSHKHARRLLAATLSASLAIAGAPAILAAPSAFADETATATATASDTTATLQDGTYTLDATVVAESAYSTGDKTTAWAGWARMFSPAIRVIKNGDSIKVAIQYTGSAQLDSVAIGTGETTTTASDAGTVYEGTVSELGDIKVTFSYNAGPMGVMSHSVYLVTSGTSPWKGFSGTEVTKLTAGTYSVPASFKRADDTSQTSMAAGALDGSNATVSVSEDGTAKVSLKLKAITVAGITAYASSLKIYEGDTQSSATDATVVSTISGTEYPSEISFALPDGAYELGGVYVSFTVAGSPMAASQNAFLQLDFANATEVQQPAATKAPNTLKVAQSKVTVKKGKKATVQVTKAKGTVTVKSSKKKVATATYSKKTGKVTIKGVKKGTAKITVTAAGNSNYKKGTKTITVTVK